VLACYIEFKQVIWGTITVHNALNFGRVNWIYLVLLNGTLEAPSVWFVSRNSVDDERNSVLIHFILYMEMKV
jgi:hypothetical protein